MAAKWHRNSGAHHDEMMALTLEFAGREVGMFSYYQTGSTQGGQRAILFSATSSGLAILAEGEA